MIKLIKSKISTCKPPITPRINSRRPFPQLSPNRFLFFPLPAPPVPRIPLYHTHTHSTPRRRRRGFLCIAYQFERICFGRGRTWGVVSRRETNSCAHQPHGRARAGSPNNEELSRAIQWARARNPLWCRARKIMCRHPRLDGIRLFILPAGPALNIAPRAPRRKPLRFILIREN